jgi:hypothetical protein
MEINRTSNEMTSQVIHNLEAFMFLLYGEWQIVWQSTAWAGGDKNTR